MSPAPQAAYLVPQIFISSEGGGSPMPWTDGSLDQLDAPSSSVLGTEGGDSATGQSLLDFLKSLATSSTSESTKISTSLLDVPSATRPERDESRPSELAPASEASFDDTSESCYLELYTQYINTPQADTQHTDIHSDNPSTSCLELVLGPPESSNPSGSDEPDPNAEDNSAEPGLSSSAPTPTPITEPEAPLLSPITINAPLPMDSHVPVRGPYPESSSLYNALGDAPSPAPSLTANYSTPSTPVGHVTPVIIPHHLAYSPSDTSTYSSPVVSFEHVVAEPPHTLAFRHRHRPPMIATNLPLPGPSNLTPTVPHTAMPYSTLSKLMPTPFRSVPNSPSPFQTHFGLEPLTEYNLPMIAQSTRTSRASSPISNDKRTLDQYNRMSPVPIFPTLLGQPSRGQLPARAIPTSPSSVGPPEAKPGGKKRGRADYDDYEAHNEPVSKRRRPPQVEYGTLVDIEVTPETVVRALRAPRQRCGVGSTPQTPTTPTSLIRSPTSPSFAASASLRKHCYSPETSTSCRSSLTPGPMTPATARLPLHIGHESPSTPLRLITEVGSPIVHLPQIELQEIYLPPPVEHDATTFTFITETPGDFRAENKQKQKRGSRKRRAADNGDIDGDRPVKRQKRCN